MRSTPHGVAGQERCDRKGNMPEPNEGISCPPPPPGRNGGMNPAMRWGSDPARRRVPPHPHKQQNVGPPLRPAAFSPGEGGASPWRAIARPRPRSPAGCPCPVASGPSDLGRAERYPSPTVTCPLAVPRRPRFVYRQVGRTSVRNSCRHRGWRGKPAATMWARLVLCPVTPHRTSSVGHLLPREKVKP